MAADAPAPLGASDSALFETLLLEAPVAFAFYDAELRYRRINRLLAETNGRPIEAHIGRRPAEVLSPPLGSAVETILERVLATGQPVSDDYSAVGPDGETRHWQSQWFPTRGAGGRVEGVAVIVVDVTLRRRSEDALRRSQARTQRLQQATAELAGAMRVREVLDVVARIGRVSLGAAATDVVLAGGHLDPLATTAVRTGAPVYTGTGAAVPLVTSGAPLGALTLAFGAARDLEEDERVFLEALAGQAALALERARLYEREHRTAQALQRSLLPDRLPRVAGIELVARYAPGVDEAQVGGDWYDAFVLPSGQLAVVVGDIMGKGLTAAAGMGRVRAAVRALALSDPSPAAVIGGLDRLFTATEAPDHIATLMYAVVDPRTGAVVASGAGHPPVLHVRGDGGAPGLVDAGQGSTPLGVPEPRTELCLALRPGDALVAFSDGLVETRRRSVGEGLDLLVRTAGELAATSLAPLVDALLLRMAQGARLTDDVTVLALRFTPGAGTG